MARAFVTGENEVINNILRAADKMIDKVADATERTTIDVANHAKANHERDSAHTKGRFETQTGTLVRSIDQDLMVTVKEIKGVVFTNVVYAPILEFGTVDRFPWPFMYPALRAMQNKFNVRLKEALKE